MSNARVIGAGLARPFSVDNFGPNTTVESALEMSGADYEGLVVSVNGVRCDDLSQRLADGDVITFASSVKGA